MHPVAYSAQHQGEDRNRLTTFFRGLMVIPVMIVGFFYVIGAYIAAIIAWFAIVFTGNYPEGLYNFNAGVIRFLARVNGYYDLLTDEYPPFGLDEEPQYPVRVQIDPPLAEYSRAKTLFRIILMIPVYLLAAVMGMIAGVVAFISWFAILFTGRFSDGLYKPLRAALSYGTKAAAYFLLLTEDWPPFWEDEEDEAPRFSGQLAAGAGAAAEPYAAEAQAPPPPPPPPQ